MSYPHEKPSRKKSPALRPSEPDSMKSSVANIMRAMGELEIPLCESRRLLPRANRHLDKITTRTEAAAHNMMDKIEQVIENQDKISRLGEQLIGLLNNSRAKDKNTLIELARNIIELAVVAKNNSFQIVDTLQFQDVTSQETENAAGLLEDVERRLLHLQSLIAEAGGPGDCLPDPAETSLAADSPAAETQNQKEVDIIFSRITGLKTP